MLFVEGGDVTTDASSAAWVQTNDARLVQTPKPTSSEEKYYSVDNNFHKGLDIVVVRDLLSREEQRRR